MRGRWHGSAVRLLVVAGGAMLMAACARRTATPVIGLALNSISPHVGAVAQAVIDRGGSLGGPPITVRGPGPTDAAGLFAEVEGAVARASDHDVVVVVGPGGSREALQVAPIYRDAGLPNIVPTATSSQLRAFDEWTFVLAPNDSVQGEFLGTFAAERLHADSALLFYIPDEYGLGLMAGTAAALSKRGVQVQARVPLGGDGSCPPGTGRNDYQDAVDAELRSARPDVIVLALRDRAAACVARAARLRLPGVRFLAGDGVLVDRTFLAWIGPAADSFYLAAFWHPAFPDSSSRAFVTEFERVVGRSPRHDDAMFYDAIMLSTAAIRAVGGDRQAIRAYLRDLGRTRPPYAGITGPIAFTPTTHRPLIMLQIRRGATEMVQQ
jgi:branched-chain amino acid transport system substrate-binding protein